MADELLMIIRVGYEPNPMSYINEQTTADEMTPRIMADIDQEEFSNDPDALPEWLMDHLDDLSLEVVPKKGERAYLGYATTGELIKELAARAEVAKTIGEEWPNYKTVTSED